MNKNDLSIIREIVEFLDRADESESEVLPYCPGCGRDLESVGSALCDGDIILCDECFMELMLGDDSEDLSL